MYRYMGVNEELGLCYVLKMISVFFMCSYIFLLLCKKMFFFLYFLISVTFGAVTIFDQAFVKSIKSWQGEFVFNVSFLKGESFVRWGMWWFDLKPWILIGLDYSLVEYLSNAVVPVSNFRSSNTFSLMFHSFLIRVFHFTGIFIHSFYPC